MKTLILFLHDAIIAEVAERSPIVYKIVVTDQAEKFGLTTVRLFDYTTDQDATFNMRGQLYRGHTNATALFSSLAM